MAFDAEPRPEKWIMLSAPSGAPRNSFVVGTHTRTHSPSGLKMIPTKEVLFAIGDPEGEDEGRIFGLSARDARLLAARLLEFSDAIEGSHVPT